LFLPSEGTAVTLNTYFDNPHAHYRLGLFWRPAPDHDGFGLPEELIGLGKREPQIGPEQLGFVGLTSWCVRRHYPINGFTDSLVARKTRQTTGVAGGNKPYQL